MPSKALEVNITSRRVDVTVSDKYTVLQEVMSKYPDIMDGLEGYIYSGGIQGKETEGR